ncbi:branched-chain-amino-acid aminotransferase-like protein 2 [Patiria miniata]|uniref:Sulfotransferase family protein n=1 Tax=Patiria miniata TaxID=46514 RepID=A0A913YYD6_PATMI|nr:branched-chain-amino-acid aminotransferase-like protein 2 [Patiria miniata]
MSDQLKVILWCCPRSLSTAFLKCMSAVPDSQMIFELYSTAMLFGPDRLAKTDIAPLERNIPENILDERRKDPGCGYPVSICSNAWVKHHLKTGYPDKKFVFAKEMVSSLMGKFQFLPESGYRHAFLLRNPAKLFPSWKKLIFEIFRMNNIPVTMEQLEIDKLSAEIMPPGKAFKEMYDLYSYIKEKDLDPDPVIIDADDLLSDPATILSGFCQKLGIPYTDSLLTWDEGVDVLEKWVVSEPIKHIILNGDGFKNFRSSTGFAKPSSKDQAPESPAKSPDPSPDIQRLIDFTMPYYTKMYEQLLE